MRIFYIGNYLHPHCTEVHLAREMTSLGHRVVRHQESDRVRLSALDHVRQRILEEAPDLVMWTRTWGLPHEATRLWRELEDDGIPTISYHLDLYHGLRRQANIVHDPFWTTGTVFTPDGNQSSQEAFEALGIRHRFMPPGVVSDECTPGRPNATKYPHDVVFVGTGQPPYHPEWPWRAELIRTLRRTYGGRFAHYGLGGLPTIRNWQLNDLYATAKVVVGDSLQLRPARDEMYTSDRPFETIGRGGVLVYPRLRILDELGFEPWVHYAPYETGNRDHLTEVVTALLRDDERRTFIRAEGQRFVAANHTYRHRLDQALSLVEAS